MKPLKGPKTRTRWATRFWLLSLAFVLIVCGPQGSWGQPQPHQVKAPIRRGVMLTPAELHWKPMRAPVGGESADLVGGRMQSGFYVERVRYPAHFINDPHSHPEDRTYTVISGTLYVGFGDTLSQSALKALPPGSFWSEPAGVNHYLLTKEEPVVFQITGVGPSGTTYVDPSHGGGKR